MARLFVRLTGGVAVAIAFAGLFFAVVLALSVPVADKITCHYDAVSDECRSHWMTYAIVGVAIAGALAFVLLAPMAFVHLAARRSRRGTEALMAPRLQALDEWFVQGLVSEARHGALRRSLAEFSQQQHPAQVLRLGSALAVAGACAAMALGLALGTWGRLAHVEGFRGALYAWLEAVGWPLLASGVVVFSIGFSGLVAGLAQARRIQADIDGDWQAALAEGHAKSTRC